MTMMNSQFIAGNKNVFAETSLGRRKQLSEALAKGIFFFMTLLMILPLLLIVGYLFYKAFPILSIDFLLANPQ
jgi:phosphate transport system permease protein